MAKNNNQEPLHPFETLEEVAQHLRDKGKKHTLIFAHNGIGKTRLSMAFKNIGKALGAPDTLYFNAYTEDLFSWDNDLDNDKERYLVLNLDSVFFSGLGELEMDTRIRPILSRYADFKFRITEITKKIISAGTEKDLKLTAVIFSRETVKVLEENGEKKTIRETVDNIKISRGEENIFIWCFFLVIAQLAIDEYPAYKWVKNIYIDDPISSLDDNNAIAVAAHLSKLLKAESNKINTVISTHHGLFFNVMHNTLSNRADKCFLDKNKSKNTYSLINMTDMPFYHHVSLLKELIQVEKSGKIHAYHFNALRNILEKAAAFHGFSNFESCIKQRADDPDGMIRKRIIDILSHGNYSLFDVTELNTENKTYFSDVLSDFRATYKFNDELFKELETVEETR